MKNVKTWLLFDGRYLTSPDDAVCFEMCDTLREAKRNKSDYGNDTVIVQFDDECGNLINPKIIN